MIISRSRLARELIQPFGLRKFNDEVKKIGLRFKPNLVIAVKGEAISPATVEWLSKTIGAVTALWCPDDPRFFNSLSKLIAPHYGFVFTPSEKFVETYEDAGVEHIAYLPFACEPTVHRPVSSEDGDDKYKFDVCFVGTYSVRRSKIIAVLEREAIDVQIWGPYWRFFKRGSNIHGPVFGPDLARIFGSARIVLNIHDETDLQFKPNMRVFEAAGCESFILSDRPWSLERCFEPGEELACYDEDSSLIRLAHHYLEAPEEIIAIGKRANERAYSEHTYDIRAKTILTTAS
jgi:spore maturation protein CgeB